jgi:multicomponent K+:H+ antiporter subunit D
LPQHGLVATLFFLAAIGMTGLPPLSGFPGKLLILDATRATPGAALIWTTILAGSLVALLGFARAGSVLFWNTTTATARAAPIPALAVTAACLPLALLVLLTLFAGPVTRQLDATAAQLFDRAGAVAAVLPPEAIIGAATP